MIGIRSSKVFFSLNDRCKILLVFSEERFMDVRCPPNSGGGEWDFSSSALCGR
jgi:hypothetical protein